MEIDLGTLAPLVSGVGVLAYATLVYRVLLKLGERLDEHETNERELLGDVKQLLTLMLDRDDRTRAVTPALGVLAALRPDTNNEK